MKIKNPRHSTPTYTKTIQCAVKRRKKLKKKVFLKKNSFKFVKKRIDTKKVDISSLIESI